MYIVVADDEMIVRAAFRFMLERKLDRAHVRCTKRAASLLEAVESRCPEVVILDWELPGEDPVTLINTLRTHCPHATLIITSTHPETEFRALQSGADRIVNKGEPPDALIRYLQQMDTA